MEKYIIKYLLFLFIVIDVNAIVNIKHNHSNPEKLTKKNMPFISYEISDENGDTSFLSYTQPLQNYDISIMPNTSYKYIISEDTAFHVRWRTNETCQPIYDFKKKIAITSVNDIFSHDCKLNVKIYAYDILNFEELYNQDNLPELLIVQFNDVYELRVQNIYIYIYIYKYLMHILYYYYYYFIIIIY